MRRSRRGATSTSKASGGSGGGYDGVGSTGRRAVAGLAWTVVVAYMALIWHLSSRSRIPGLESPPFPHFDKVLHACAFGGLAFLLLLAFLASRRCGRAWTGWSVLGATLYGVVDELHQSYVPGRSADVLDLVADGGGAILVGVTWQLLLAWRQAARARQEHETMANG